MVDRRWLKIDRIHSFDNIQISNKVNRQLLGVLNFGHCDLPFDSHDLEALDRLAQGGEVVSLSNHLLFVFCYLKFYNC